MRTKATSKASKKLIRLETINYLVRNATVLDASERWGRWMADGEASYMLNAPSKALTESEVASYIKMFDQKTHLLLVILEKASNRLLGFFRIDIDERLRR